MEIIDKDCPQRVEALVTVIGYHLLLKTAARKTNCGAILN